MTTSPAKPDGTPTPGGSEPAVTSEAILPTPEEVLESHNAFLRNEALAPGTAGEVAVIGERLVVVDRQGLTIALPEGTKKERAEHYAGRFAEVIAEGAGFDDNDKAFKRIFVVAREMRNEGLNGVGAFSINDDSKPLTAVARVGQGQVGLFTDKTKKKPATVELMFDEGDTDQVILLPEYSDKSIIFLTPDNVLADDQTKEDMSAYLSGGIDGRSVAQQIAAISTKVRSRLIKAAELFSKATKSESVAAVPNSKFNRFGQKILKSSDAIRNGILASEMKAANLLGSLHKVSKKKVGIGGLTVGSVAALAYIGYRARGFDFGFGDDGAAEDVASSLTTIGNSQPGTTASTIADTMPPTTGGNSTVTTEVAQQGGVGTGESGPSTTEAATTTTRATTSEVPTSTATTNGPATSSTQPASAEGADGFDMSEDQQNGATGIGDAEGDITANEPGSPVLSGEIEVVHIDSDRPEFENALVQDRHKGMDDETAHRIWRVIAGENGEFEKVFEGNDQFELGPDDDARTRGDYRISGEVPLEDGTYNLKLPEEVMDRIDELAVDQDALDEALDSLSDDHDGAPAEVVADSGVKSPVEVQFYEPIDSSSGETIGPRIELKEGVNAFTYGEDDSITADYMDRYEGIGSKDDARRMYETIRLRNPVDFEYLHGQGILYEDDRIAGPGQTFLGDRIVEDTNHFGNNPDEIWSDEKIAAEKAEIAEQARAEAAREQLEQAIDLKAEDTTSPEQAAARAEVAANIRSNLSNGGLELNVSDNKFYVSEALEAVGVPDSDNMDVVREAIELVNSDDSSEFTARLAPTANGNRMIQLTLKDGGGIIADNNDVKARMAQYLNQSLEEYLKLLEEEES